MLSVVLFLFSVFVFNVKAFCHFYIAEGLAQRIANGDVPETIEGKKVSCNYLIPIINEILFVIDIAVVRRSNYHYSTLATSVLPS